MDGDIHAVHAGTKPVKANSNITDGRETQQGLCASYSQDSIVVVAFLPFTGKARLFQDKHSNFLVSCFYTERQAEPGGVFKVIFLGLRLLWKRDSGFRNPLRKEELQLLWLALCRVRGKKEEGMRGQILYFCCLHFSITFTEAKHSDSSLLGKYIDIKSHENPNDHAKVIYINEIVWSYIYKSFVNKYAARRAVLKD